MNFNKYREVRKTPSRSLGQSFNHRIICSPVYRRIDIHEEFEDSKKQT